VCKRDFSTYDAFVVQLRDCDAIVVRMRDGRYFNDERRDDDERPFLIDRPAQSRINLIHVDPLHLG